MNSGMKDKPKVIALCVLGAVMLYVFYDNVLAGPSVPAHVAPVAAPGESPRAAPGPPSGGAAAPAERASNVRRSFASGSGRSEEFNPALHSKRPEDRIDPTKIDPTLRLDLLAKVQGVELAGGSRNLFAIGAPPVKTAEVLKGPEPKVRMGPFPKPPDPPPPPDPATLPPPPITLKYYGIVTVRENGKKTACFMDGDEILTATEGDVLKRRYKVVKIGATSALMEDTESKRQQSVPLAPEAQV